MDDSHSSSFDRRRFLETTAWGTLMGPAGAGAIGCGAAPPRILPDAEADRLIGRLQHRLHAVRNAPPVAQLTDNHSNHTMARVTKLGIEALVVADVARSIPGEMAVPARLADAIGRELPVLDRCAGTYASLLAAATPAVRRNVDQRLREEPDLVMQIAERIDSLAAGHELNHDHRLRLRQIATNVTRRMRRQSASAVVDDTVGKVERIVAQRGESVSFARQAGAHALVSSIWQTVDQGGAAPLPPPPSGPSNTRVGRLVPGPVQTDRIPTPEGELSFEYDTGDDELVAGGIMLGSGIAVFGIAALVGFAAFSSPWGAVIGATPGAVLIVLGLVFLGIGSSRSGTPPVR